MPGHKGKKLLGFEPYDITEINGADDLFHAKGIIKESEANASKLFGFKTFYSTEGSSLAIRAMLYLAMTASGGNKTILAARNVHKTFVTAAALLDLNVAWLYGEENSYYSINITGKDLDLALSKMAIKPFAVYVTSPDYLGHILDIKDLKRVCQKYDIPLLVDNAHGAYLHFLEPSLHPLDLGADMCASSAHKTLPALTGCAYLQISNDANCYFALHAKEALALFASTSPSYLLLASLDYTNYFLDKNKNLYSNFNKKLLRIKAELEQDGYQLVGNEVMKIVIDAKAYGYTGEEINEYLTHHKIISEFFDQDYIVLMPTPLNSNVELKALVKALKKLNKKTALQRENFKIEPKERTLTIKEATFALKKQMKVEEALGAILADTAVTCPPAVPILVCGEVITANDIEMFKHYGINECLVVKKREE